MGRTPRDYSGNGRDLALIELLSLTGCRRSEASKLDVDDVDRCVPPRWSLRAHQHLRTHAEGTGAVLTNDHRWQPASAGFGPAAQNVLDDLTSRGLAHRYATHIRSSQALALNLFAPL